MPGAEAMRKFKAGTLHSGSKKGPVVKSRKRAVAIMLNEKRAAGEHIPQPRHNSVMDYFPADREIKGPYGMTEDDLSKGYKHVKIPTGHGEMGYHHAQGNPYMVISKKGMNMPTSRAGYHSMKYRNKRGK